MSEYRIIAQDELYHSKAHKYIKREWKNGHWVYTYTKKMPDTAPFRSPSGHQRDMRIWSAVEERYFNSDKKFLKELNDPKFRPLMNKKDREFTIKEVKKSMNASGRNMAAYKQELSRIEANKPKNKIKRKVGNVQSWLSKALTTKTSVSSAKSKKKGKNWLSKVLSTSKTTTHHSFGTTTTKKH